MIYAQELRIGNLVYRDKNIEPIPMILPYFSHLHRLDPVSITEEWLLKFGFSSQVFMGYTIFRKGLHFIKYMNGKYYFQLGEGLIVELIYIHRLQNLYFELTDTEFIFE